MTVKHAPMQGMETPSVYRIEVQGHLDHDWNTWFDGMTITRAEHGVTVLTGPVSDQAALYGLLKRVRDLGMPLLAVIRDARAGAPHVKCDAHFERRIKR